MKQLKVGDRVRIAGNSMSYGSGCGSGYDGAHRRTHGRKGTVNNFVSPDASSYHDGFQVAVKIDGETNNLFYFARKQLTPLKKKPKQRLWVNEYSDRRQCWTHLSKEDADNSAGENRSALLECVVVKRHEEKK